jgi:two-component system sensor histidine kinase CpxA
MDKLIGDVLMLSRTEANMAKRESISLKEVLNDVLHNAEFEASQNKIIFTADTIPQLQVTVQKDAVQSAVENIIRNAIRYTKSKVHVDFKTNEKHWSICVEDDGPGLPESQLEKIFAPFYRSDTARDLKTGGTGLGLAIAKASVTAHHGTISARNLPAGGLAVTITMAYSNT